MTPPTLGHPQYQLPVPSLQVRRKRTALKYSPKSTGTVINPQGIIANSCNLRHWAISFSSEPFLPLPFWLRPPKRESWDDGVSLGVIFGIHCLWDTPSLYPCSEALLNSHYTYEILLLTAPHITLSCCDNLNPVFPPSSLTKLLMAV